MFVFLLIFINMSIYTCQYIEPSVTFNLDRSKVTKFPWMVVISNISSIISYGSLIHPQAVLALKLYKPTPTVFNLKVFANCYLPGDEVTFDYKVDCSFCRIVSTLHIFDGYQEPNIDKVTVLSLSKPFVINRDVGVISLNQWDWGISELDCGILSIRTLKDFSESRATFFSLNQVAMNIDNQTSINLVGSFTPSHSILYNDMGEESYNEYENTEFELHFHGSPLVCKSTHLKGSPYIQVGIVNKTFKKHRDNRNSLTYFESSGEVVRIDKTKLNIQRFINKIIELA